MSGSNGEMQEPFYLLKSGTGTEWEARWLRRVGELGIYGVEVAISVNGDEDHDKQVLEKLDRWADAWNDAGLAVYIHPYTKGTANPAQTIDPSRDGPLKSFRMVADFAAELADRSGKAINLTYHAAGVNMTEPDTDPKTPRSEYLERSIRFFDLAFAYLDTLEGHVTLTSETQLPTIADEPRIRIGDRPDEVVETARSAPAGICLDTGHYLLASVRVDAPLEPPLELIQRVSHMHVHDVIDGRDHRPVTAESDWVAYYVGLAAKSGHLRSITMEYNYGEKASTPVGMDEWLDHYAGVMELLRSWSRNPEPTMPSVFKG